MYWLKYKSYVKWPWILIDDDRDAFCIAIEKEYEWGRGGEMARGKGVKLCIILMTSINIQHIDCYLYKYINGL